MAHEHANVTSVNNASGNMIDMPMEFPAREDQARFHDVSSLLDGFCHH